MVNKERLLRQLSSQLSHHHESYRHDGYDQDDFLLLNDDDSSLVHVAPSSPHIGKLLSPQQSSNNDNNNSENNGSQQQQRRPILSFFVVYTMIFFNGCCFTAVVPSVPFYLQMLGAPPSFLGWVVSFYSLGQIFGSPLGGWLADSGNNKSAAAPSWFSSSRSLLTLSSTLGLLASALYSVAPSYPLILVSRLLTGVSAGMEFSVELTFIARNTTPKERTVYLASVTAVNVVGFILGPALGGLLATLDLNLFGGMIKVDKYTGPGWLLTIMFIVDVLMVQLLFESDISKETPENKELPTEEAKLLETKKNQEQTPKETQVSYGGVDDNDEEEKYEEEEQTLAKELIKSLRDSQRPPAISLVLGLIFVQFTVMMAWSVLETITSPLAQDHFDWDVQECNLLFTGGGAVSLVAYVIFVVASKCVQDRWLIVYALIVCFVGQMLAIDWTELPWLVPDWWSSHLPSLTYRNRFLIGYALMNGGFMTGRPVTFALYSKLIGSQYQGKYLGWMVAGGSLARTLGPFAAVAVYYGIKTIVGANLLALFGSVGFFHVVCLFMVIYQWPQLLPPKRTQLSIRATRVDEEKEGGNKQWRLAVEKDEEDDDDDEAVYVKKLPGKQIRLSLRVTDTVKRGHSL